MAHRSRQADVDLNDIWPYIAKQSGSVEIADSVADSVTRCFSSNLLEAKRAEHHNNECESRNDVKKSPDNKTSLASGLACIAGSARV
jgi:hypothetical protein